MSGYTQEQLDEQLVLIKRYQAGDLSIADLDTSIAALQMSQSVVNDARDLVLDARRKLDGWIGGEFQRREYAPVGSMCQSAGYNAATSGGDYTTAFNEVWTRENTRIKLDAREKRKVLRMCGTVEEVAKLSREWGGPEIEIPHPVISDELQKSSYLEWEITGGKFYNARSGIPEGINRLVLIKDNEEDYRIRAFTGQNRNWMAAYPGIQWDSIQGTYTGGYRWDGHITKSQFEVIKEKGKL